MVLLDSQWFCLACSAPTGKKLVLQNAGTEKSQIMTSCFKFVFYHSI